MSVLIISIISIVLTVASIICTILFGMRPIPMKKNQIFHYFINSYDIGKGLTDEFPEFALHYGNEVLSNNVKVLKGGFMNTGRNDIGDKSDVTEINMVLPEGCTVKAVKVSPICKKLKVDGTISPNKDNKNGGEGLNFKINGIMKSKEWFNYTAIIETPDIKGSIYKQLDFDHRIKNTRLEKIYLGSNYTVYTKMIPRIVKMTIKFGVGLGVVFILLWFGVRLFGDYELQNGSEALLILGFVYLILGIVVVVADRWGKKGRVLHELLKKYKNQSFIFEDIDVEVDERGS